MDVVFEFLCRLNKGQHFTAEPENHIIIIMVHMGVFIWLNTFYLWINCICLIACACLSVCLWYFPEMGTSVALKLFDV